MSVFKFNYKLIGKQSKFYDMPISPEETRDYGEGYSVPITSCYFTFNFDTEPNVVSFEEGVGTAEFELRNSVGGFDKMKIGKDYMLIVKGNRIVYFQELTDEDKKEGSLYD